MAAFILIAMMIGSSALVLVAAAVTLVASVASPSVGMVVIAFLAPIPRPEVIPAPGLYVVVLGATVFGALLRLPIERPRLRAPSPPLVLVLGFFVYITAQYAGGSLVDLWGSRAAAVSSLFAGLAAVILAFVVASITLRGRSPYPVLTALIGSAVFAGAIAISQSLGAEGLFGNLAGPSKMELRITGPFDDPNYFGAYLAAATSLAVACAAVARSLRVRVLVLLAATITAASLLLTLSRGAVIAMLAGLIVIAFAHSRRAGVMIVVAAAAGVALLYPVFAESRFGVESDLAGAGLTGQVELSGRLTPWLAGLEQFISAPLFGIGFGRMVEESAFGGWAHNWYITLLGESGAVGFVLWLLFVVACLLALRRAPRGARTVGLGVLAAWLTASLSLETPVFYSASALAVLSIAAALVADWRDTVPGAAIAERSELPSPTSRGRPGSVLSPLVNAGPNLNRYRRSKSGHC